MTESEKIEQAIAALEAQRGILGDEVVNMVLAPLRQKLAELQAQAVFPEHQRKQITVLFADIVNSTQIVQHLDPEDVSEIFDGALQRLARPVQAHHGHVTRFMGDGFLAVFGTPRAHEDDPEQVPSTRDPLSPHELKSQKLSKARHEAQAVRTTNACGRNTAHSPCLLKKGFSVYLLLKIVEPDA